MAWNWGWHGIAKNRREVIRLASLVCVGCLAAALFSSPGRAEGELQQLRDDVRGVPAPASETPAPPSEPETPASRKPWHSDNSGDWENDDSWSADALLGAAILVGAGLTSPFWGPHALLGDDFSVWGYFPCHPYDQVAGDLFLDRHHWAESDQDAGAAWLDPWPEGLRRWSARFDVDYADDFDRLNQIGSHLLVSTSSRWDVDTEFNYLEESRRSHQRDQLWLGDVNLTYRFAQSERAQFRTGLGLNWLDDRDGTDLGVNFTYGMDLFPCKPWVLTSSIDWGTLGHAELFRFRSTAGVMVHNFEVYTGYEYLDIDRTRSNSLIGGVRVWF
jgi:hypothetical protein